MSAWKEICFDCSECAAGKPYPLISFLGKEEGFLVKLECAGCGQASSGTKGLPYTPELLMKEAEKWNSEQEGQWLERVALSAPKGRIFRM